MEGIKQNNNHPIIYHQIVFILICPLLALIPIVVNFFSAYIFSNIEFKTKTYRYLKLNAIVDALSMVTLLFFPLTECEELCSGWWNSNYWLIVYRLYINYYLTRVLQTISTILSVTIAWNRCRSMDQHKNSGNIFYLTILLNIIFSCLMHSPKIFLHEIVLQNNNTLDDSKIYALKMVQIEVINNLLLILNFLFMIVVLIFTVCLNVKLVLNIRKQINAKFKSIKLIKKDEETEKIVLEKSRNSTIQSFYSAQLNSETNQINSYKIIFSKTKLMEFESSLMVFWITVVFIVDIVLQTAGVAVVMLLKRDSKEYFFVLIFLYIFIIVSHLGYFCVYYKFNRSFSERIKLLKIIFFKC
jgi:hypothetical protein